MDVARHGWLLAALAVTVLSLAVVFAPQVLAAPSQPVDPGKWSQHWDEQVAQGRIVNGDLTVEPGQVIESDVVLYDGDVDVREEGRIAGNLVVYSGDIVIGAGGAVDGDVSAFSGDVEIDGTVGGNVASWSGDIALGASARRRRHQRAQRRRGA
ncbi:MAG: polymer-forming cytoskeletal protein [Caldilineaceae bacterium]